MFWQVNLDKRSENSPTKAIKRASGGVIDKRKERESPKTSEFTQVINKGKTNFKRFTAPTVNFHNDCVKTARVSER